MKRLTVFLLFLLLLVAGCSLTDTEAPSGTAHLRLLQGTGGMTTLSDPDYDDWSPCMVNYQGTNYIYFLSTRPFSGEVYKNGKWDFISNVNTNGSTGVFRAEMVAPGVYTNLQLFFEFPTNQQVINITAVSNSDFSLNLPQVWLSSITESTTNLNYLDDNGNSIIELHQMASSPPYLGGSWSNNTGPRLFLGDKETQSRTIIPLISPITFNATVYKSYDLTVSGEIGNAVLQISPDLSGILPQLIDPYRDIINQGRLNEEVVFRGSCPAAFTLAGNSKNQFGFYLSMNGVLFQLIYLQAPDYSEFITQTENAGLANIITEFSLLQKQRFLPLLSVTHYPGTIDKNPSYYPAEEGKGLYFASDREGRGRFNLYYVPEEYLKIPAALFNPFSP